MCESLKDRKRKKKKFGFYYLEKYFVLQNLLNRMDQAPFDTLSR